MKTNPANVRAQNFGRQALQHPLVRMVIAFSFVVAGLLLAQLGIALLRLVFPRSTPLTTLITIGIALAAGYFAYRLYVHLVEKRPLSELAPAGAGVELGAGALIGAGLLALILGLLWILGVYRVDGVNSWLVIFPALAADLPSGFIQEILFRGIIFRITEDALGSLWAMVLSALIFGAIHLFSASSNIAAGLLSAVEAGALFGAAYLLTRRLWLAIGIHTAWDFTSDGIFGAGSSGGTTGEALDGILRGSLAGPAILSGGAGGVEASLLTLVVIAAACAILLWAVIRTGRWRASPRKARP